MIEERVVVVAMEAQGAWVEGVQQSACGSCSAKSGCGQHALGKMGRIVRLWLPTEVSLSQGEHIVIGLEQGVLAKSALWLYGIPLLVLLLGAVVGQWLGGELGSIVLTVLGLPLGLMLARYYSAKNTSAWQPNFIRRCDDSTAKLIQAHRLDGV